MTLANGEKLGKRNDIIRFYNEDVNYGLAIDDRLTQSEIESVDPILMEIAKPVKTEGEKNE